MRVRDELRIQAHYEYARGIETMGKTLVVRNVVIWLGTNSNSHYVSVVTSFPETMNGDGGDDDSYSFLMIYCVYHPVLIQNPKMIPPDSYAICVVFCVFYSYVLSCYVNCLHDLGMKLTSRTNQKSSFHQRKHPSAYVRIYGVSGVVLFFHPATLLRVGHLL
jgi:hypothetical protein